MNEVWLPVREFPEHYEVSNLGRVRRKAASTGTRIGKVRKPVINKAGYAQFMLSVNNKLFMRDGHRLVADAFQGPIPPGMQVNHINGIKSDNRETNLEIVTNGENRSHSYRVLGVAPNSGPIGIDNHNAFLSWEQVCAIRKAYDDGGATMQEVADHYNTTKQTIWRIIHKKVRRDA